MYSQVQSVLLTPINDDEDADNEEDQDGALQEDIADFAELEYFCQAASKVATLSSNSHNHHMAAANF